MAKPMAHVVEGKHSGPSNYKSDAHKATGDSFNATKSFVATTGKKPPMMNVKWK